MSESDSSSSNSSSQLVGMIKNWLGLKDSVSMPDEINDLIESREESNIPLSDEEKHLIMAALQFSDVEADSVAVPRSDIVSIPATADFETCIRVFQEYGHSRMPVIRNDTDDVLGFITLKDMIRFIGRTDEFKLQKILRPCTFVPDTQSIARVLQEMKRTRVQMAVVVDEYGGTAGLVTLKDILEHLVGDIDDENDKEEPLMFVPLPRGRFQVDPRMPMRELEEKIGLGFNGQDDEEDRDYETVGGYILSLARRVPAAGETFRVQHGCEFKIIEADARRIQKIELKAPAKKKQSA